MIGSTLKIARYCPLVIQGFSNFQGLFEVIMTNPVVVQVVVHEQLLTHPYTSKECLLLGSRNLPMKQDETSNFPQVSRIVILPF